MGGGYYELEVEEIYHPHRTFRNLPRLCTFDWKRRVNELVTEEFRCCECSKLGFQMLLYNSENTIYNGIAVAFGIHTTGVYGTGRHL
jgi:hypothetical protein